MITCTTQLLHDLMRALLTVLHIHQQITAGAFRGLDAIMYHSSVISFAWFSADVKTPDCFA